METKNITVGLFGTCGNSKWRDPFMDKCMKDNLNYFNPDAGSDWHPGMIAAENEHLQTDDIILFPVTAETTGFGSLGEIGFSALNVVRRVMNGYPQYLIVFIDDDCSDISANDVDIAHSVKTRKLVKSKILDVHHQSIIVVDNMQDMLEAMSRVVDQLEQLRINQEIMKRICR